MGETCLGGLMFVSGASSFVKFPLAQLVNFREQKHVTSKALRVLAKIVRGVS
jgi:hypothetical protein